MAGPRASNGWMSRGYPCCELCAPRSAVEGEESGGSMGIKMLGPNADEESIYHMRRLSAEPFNLYLIFEPEAPQMLPMLAF